jgi:CheY-like chemotaxis protein
VTLSTRVVRSFHRAHNPAGRLSLSTGQVIQLISAVAQLVGVLVWPAVLLFFLVRFRGPLADFFANMGELNVKALGIESTAKRQREEAVAALGAAVAARGPAGGRSDVSSDPRDVADALPSPRAQRRLQGSRVLWVDDRPDNNRFERQALEALGVQVDLSISTEEALDSLSRRPYDLIISDMGRPPDSRAGYTLLDRLRASGDRTPYVIYASSRAPEHVKEAREHGALGCTNQPEELISMVTRALSN